MYTVDHNLNVLRDADRADPVETLKTYHEPDSPATSREKQARS
jgi:hypothetical protein